jgi:hypothetical protein
VESLQEWASTAAMMARQRQKMVKKMVTPVETTMRGNAQVDGEMMKINGGSDRLVYAIGD